MCFELTESGVQFVKIRSLDCLRILQTLYDKGVNAYRAH
jgi:hypothetical protein